MELCDKFFRTTGIVVNESDSWEVYVQGIGQTVTGIPGIPACQNIMHFLLSVMH